MKSGIRQRRSVQERDASFLSNVGHGTKIGRNNPCPCGTGKKYKRRCL
ncbi:SEC-C metal-binding domain-containing protein [Bradyrhizobium tropiciagri]